MSNQVPAAAPIALTPAAEKDRGKGSGKDLDYDGQPDQGHREATGDQHSHLHLLLLGLGCGGHVADGIGPKAGRNWRGGCLAAFGQAWKACQK